MIYVKFTKDIRSYKTKMFCGLTARQLICFLIGVLSGIFLNTFAKKYIGDELASWLTIIIELPVFAIGFVNIQGMAAEKFFALFIKNRLKNSGIIVFKNDNVYSYMEEAIDRIEKGNLKKTSKKLFRSKKVQE